MNPIDQCIGSNFLRLKTNARISDERLAELLEVETSDIQSYVNGNKRISASQIWALSEILNVSIKEFFEGAA